MQRRLKPPLLKLLPLKPYRYFFDLDAFWAFGF